MENQSANIWNFQNQEHPLLVSNFRNFQIYFISELNSIKNLFEEESKLSKLNFQENIVAINQKLIENNEILINLQAMNQNYQEHSVTNTQNLIEVSQKNQEDIQNTQTLIIQNHSQLIEKFTTFSTLFQDLKESFENTILNRITEGINQVRTEIDKNLHSQITTDTITSFQNYYSQAEERLKASLNKFNNDNKTTLQQIFIKLSDHSVEGEMMKKFKQLKSNIKNSNKNQEITDLLDANNQENRN
jgi:hypothetical protein